MKIYMWDSVFDFGKFKGQTLKLVDEQLPSYIFWCIQTIDWFCVDKEIFNNLSIVIRYRYIVQKHVLIIDPSIRKVIRDYEEQLELIANLNSKKLLRIDSKPKEYHRQQNKNWLSDAAGTDDDETMNDVYWNLD